MFLVNSRYHPLSATPFSSGSKSLHLIEAHLLPKLRCHFAEFLNQSCLIALGFSPYPPVLVWGTVEYITRLEDFLVSVGSITLRSKELVITSQSKRVRICLHSKPTGLNHLFQQVDDLPYCVPPSLKRYAIGTGILTCFPSSTPFGLDLGAD